MNKEIIDAVKSTESVEELKDLAAKNGYKLTDEKAESYFNLFHTNGAIAEGELDNISGGGFCDDLNGAFESTYSSDSPHNLIVLPTNSCGGFEFDENDHLGHNATCRNCIHYYGTGFVHYCKRRTKGNDPWYCTGRVG